MFCSHRHLLFASGVFGALAVALGAFGAHALRDVLDAYSLEVYSKATTYHFYHAIALLGIAAVTTKYSTPWLLWAGRCFIIGIVLFSGSLYTLAFTGVKMLGMVTPFGGLAFIAGWVCVVVAAIRSREA